MFEKYFGLTENPFNLTPDPKYLYSSEIHKEALAHLKYGIDERKGFVLITGEIGAGKTTLCRVILKTMPEDIKSALILNPSLSDIELLQTINQEFGINSSSSSKKALLDELYGFLLDVRSKGENAVLIIDECQNLSPDVLEQIRMLSNLETEKEKLLQIILIGQPELRTLLSTPAMKQINDRIIVRYHMGLLSKSDTKDYIKHRLIVSGSHGDIKFTRRALDNIFNFSGGLPRRINAVCERSLLTAFTKGTTTINGSITKTAIREITGEKPGQTYTGKILAMAAIVIAVAGIVYFWNPVLSIIEENTGIAKVNDYSASDSPNTPMKVLPPKNDWVVNDYRTALNKLGEIQESAGANSVLNLHPPADFLSHISTPFIASVWGGYCIVKQIDSNVVEIIKSKSETVNIPAADFVKIYQGHAVALYRKNPSRMTFGLSSSGSKVTQIQEKLRELGCITVEPNGIYGIETSEGIEKLQELCGLAKDGIAGTETLGLLNILKGKII